MSAKRPPEFEELWARHHREVYAYALRRTDRESAQDAVAETFLVAWRRRGEIPERVVPWLLGVARLVISNSDRSGRRREALLAAMTANAHAYAEPDEPVDDRLLAAIAALTPDDREAIMLVAWEGLEPSQAASVLGCTPVAFRVRLMRARRRLRAALDTPAGTPAPAPATEAV